MAPFWQLRLSKANNNENINQQLHLSCSKIISSRGKHLDRQCGYADSAWKVRCLLLFLSRYPHTHVPRLCPSLCQGATSEPMAAPWPGARAGTSSNTRESCCCTQWSAVDVRGVALRQREDGWAEGSKSVLVMGSGLNQPDWVGAVWMESVLLLFNLFGVINGKTYETTPLPKWNQKSSYTKINPPLSIALKCVSKQVK